MRRPIPRNLELVFKVPRIDFLGFLGESLDNIFFGVNLMFELGVPLSSLEGRDLLFLEGLEATGVDDRDNRIYLHASSP